MSLTSVQRTELSLIVGGEPVMGSASFDVINPATGESLATAPEASLTQLDQAPVLPYRDIDEAVALANATTFGLDCSVWGQDTDRAMAMRERLECRTTWVNIHALPLRDAPFRGQVKRPRFRGRAGDGR